MRRTFLSCLFAGFLATAALLSAAQIAAQTATQTAAPSNAPAAEKTRAEPLVEQIHLQDRSVAIDEVRVGGVTRQIDVQTKSGMPGYQIQPTTGPQGSATPAGERTGSQGSAGRASWRLLNF